MQESYAKLTLVQQRIECWLLKIVKIQKLWRALSEVYKTKNSEEKKNYEKN